MAGRELGISGSIGVVVGGLTEGDSWVKAYYRDEELVSGVMLLGHMLMLYLGLWLPSR